jgi:hydroxymethylpyrimidine/phosphomethylpyrimidine kinase
MPRRAVHPCALTIAGSDSGGGAGVQMDLKVFASLGVHGTSAITCLTAQNPDGVTGIQSARADMVAAQIEAVFEGFAPRAVKTGMLYSAPIIRTVVATLSRLEKPPAMIVDPVMIATSGAALLKPAARRALENELLPQATLVTPNLDEAMALIGREITDVGGLRAAAREIRERFGCAALVKGGHLKGSRNAVDAFSDGRNEMLLEAPFVRGVSTHGTGCSYSAAIAGHVALGCSLKRAVRNAKEHVTGSIRQSIRSGRHSVLNSFWRA